MLFEFDRPIGVVEELLPAAITLMAQEDMKKRIMLRFYGLSEKRHTGLSGGSPGLFDITFCAGTDNISPNSFPSHTPRYNVVE
jgi:hypothetical protein